MDILAIYNSLPNGTVAEVARRKDTSTTTVSNRLVKSLDRETWECVFEVLDSTGEKVDSLKDQITELLQNRIPKSDGGQTSVH